MSQQPSVSSPPNLWTVGHFILKNGWGFILIIALSLILAIIINLKPLVQSLSSPRVITTEVQKLILGELATQDHLVTATMNTVATVKITEDNHLGRIPLGNSNLIYEGAVKIQAGMNLRQVHVQPLDKTTHKIQITLPPPKILDVSLDIENSRIVDKYTKGLIHPGEKISLQQKAQDEVLKIAKNKACNKQILDTANQSAERLIRHILSHSQYSEFTIETQTGHCS